LKALIGSEEASKSATFFLKPIRRSARVYACRSRVVALPIVQTNDEQFLMPIQSMMKTVARIRCVFGSGRKSRDACRSDPEIP
jgi:hypothetical protein